MTTLQNKKIAILTDDGFEEVELTSPKKALEDAGASVHFISMQTEKVKAWNHDSLVDRVAGGCTPCCCQQR